MDGISWDGDRYNALVNLIDQGFFIIDMIFDANNKPIDMYYVEANEASVKMLGMDFTGKRLRDIDQNYEEHWYEDFGNVALTGQAARMERYAYPDKRWYSYYIFKIGDENSRRIGNIFLDITERKKTEEALKESEQLFRTLFGNTEDGFVLVQPILDESGHSDNYLMVDVNQAWERQTGLKAVDLIGKTIRECLPEVESIWPLTFASVLKSGISEHFESFNRDSNRWYDLYAFNYKKDQVGVLFRDITERKKMEKALRASEERQTFLLRMSDAFKPLADPVRIQSAAVRLLGEHLVANQVHYVETVGDVVIIHQGYGNGLPPMTGRFPYMAFGERLVATYRAGKTAVCYNVNTDLAITEDEAKVITGSGFRAYIAVPLVKDGEWVATLAAHSIEPREWTPEEVLLVEDVAERTWAAVERARAEEALQYSENLLSTIIEGIGEPVYLKDTHSRMLLANSAVAQAQGQPLSDILGKSDLEFFENKESGKMVLENDRQVMESNKIQVIEETVEIPDGVRTYLSTKVPWHDAEGKVIGIFGISRDITERKNIELALRKTTEDLNEALESMENRTQELKALKDILSDEVEALNKLYLISTHYIRLDDMQNIYNEILDAAISVTHASKGTMQLSEQNSDYLNIVAHRGFDKPFLQHFEKVTSGHAACGWAFKYKQRVIVEDVEMSPIFMGTPDLQVLLNEGVTAVQSTPMISSSGGFLGVLATHYKTKHSFSDRELQMLDLLACQTADVVERARIEKDLEETKHKALDLVEELREADRNKNEFISVLSHELRNPLASILAGLSLIGMSKNEEQISKTNEIINRQIKQLCKLVDDLLDLTRITQNKIELKKERININEIVLDSVSDIKSQYEEKGVQLEAELKASHIVMNADPVRISQTIENLLFNALKFTPKDGEVHIILDQDKNDAVICVKDSGIGINMDIIPDLFNPFSQADNTLDRHNGGLGLGLSIVKGIVELHDGTVSAFSDGLGKGSMFTIRLPMHEKESMEK